jgi:hypothetical protein
MFLGNLTKSRLTSITPVASISRKRGYLRGLMNYLMHVGRSIIDVLDISRLTASRS